jgi:hypothetical protein
VPTYYGDISFFDAHLLGEEKNEFAVRWCLRPSKKSAPGKRIVLKNHILFQAWWIRSGCWSRTTFCEQGPLLNSLVASLPRFFATSPLLVYCSVCYYVWGRKCTQRSSHILTQANPCTWLKTTLEPCWLGLQLCYTVWTFSTAEWSTLRGKLTHLCTWHLKSLDF